MLRPGELGVSDEDITNNGARNFTRKCKSELRLAERSFDSKFGHLLAEPFRNVLWTSWPVLKFSFEVLSQDLEWIEVRLRVVVKISGNTTIGIHDNGGLARRAA